MVANFSCLLFFSIILLNFPPYQASEHNQITSKSLPNILIFLADDLGFGDLSCYGNQKVQTANIDQLAEDGVKLTRMYSQPICSPSRAALMTGRLPARSGMVQGVFNIPVLISPAQPSGLPNIEDEPNLASVLQSLNYKTHLVGKWHLGFSKEGSQGPTAKGFNGFYGAPMTHSEPCSDYTDMNDTVYFNYLIARFRYQLVILGVIILILRWTKIIENRGLCIILTLLALSIGTVRFFLLITLASPSSCLWVRNTTILEQPYQDQNLTLKMTDEAIEYIKTVSDNSRNLQSKNPFFLMVNYLTPHVPPILSEYHRGKSGHGMYYDSVLELDWSVGKVMSTLKEFGYDNNTLVFFSSDNGPTIYNGFTDEILDEQFRGTAGSVKNSKGENIPLSGWKGTNFEGGIRVPGIIRWPELVKGGQVTNALTSQMDILPTILDIVGLADLGRTRLFDGKSLMSLLKSPSSESSHHKFIFHYCDMRQIGAVTYLDYKLHFFEGKDNYSCRGVMYDAPRLFNLADDPGELSPLPLEEYSDVLTSIKAAIKQQEESMSDAPFFSQFMIPPIPWNYPWPTCMNISEPILKFLRQWTTFMGWV